MTEARLPSGHVVAQRYVVQRLIGRGGMGEVYVALDNKLERKVALKIVAAAGSPTAKRRLEAEAKAVASIEHPGIVTLHDVVEDGDALVLVMELVKGTSLREALAAGRLPPRTVASVIRGVAEALEAAHARGLVHRDVKPDNVIVRKDGRTALLDFGVAKAVTPSEQSPLAATVTGEGAVVGTPAYLAPEQARGEGVSPATDQFALAVTAYELLTGEMPWNASGVPAIIAAIVSSPPLPVEVEGEGGKSEELDAVFARALAKPPDERFASVIEFASALDLALGGDGGSVRAKNEVTPDAPYPSSVTRSSDRRAGRGTRVIGPDEERPKRSGDHPAVASQAGKTVRSNDAAPLRRGRRTWASLGMIGLVLVTAFGLGLWLTQGRGRAVGTAWSSAPPPRAPASAEGLDVSGASDEKGRARFREAARVYRRGDVASARRLVDEAIAGDPGFAGAALFRAYLSFILADELDETARAALRSASTHADVLTERDAEFLKALTPSFLDPPKWRDTASLLDVVVAKRPGDARALEALGIARVKLGDYSAAERAFDAQITVDPGAVLGHVVLSQILLDRGDVEASKRQLESCAREQPASGYCRAAMATVLADVGDCAGADREARDALALDPTARRASNARARAAAALGAPNEAVAAILAGGAAATAPDRIASMRTLDAVLLAWRVGDFDAALAALDAPGADPSSGDAPHFALARVRTLWEIGERARAADAAEAFLRRVATLRLPERIVGDPTGRMLAYLRAAGRISVDEHRQRRDAWLAAWRERRADADWSLDMAPYVWAQGYGSADPPTAAEGRAAVEAAAEVGYVPRPQLEAHHSELDEIGGLAGALYAAAGRDAEAEVLLVDATRTCRIAPDQHAWLALGDLRARAGDTASACAAYGEIEKAWRDAKPKSVTLEAARAARSKLRCETR